MSRACRIPEELRGGAFTVAEAEAAGLSRRQLQGSAWRRLCQGWYRWAGCELTDEVRLTPVARGLPGRIRLRRGCRRARARTGRTAPGATRGDRAGTRRRLTAGRGGGPASQPGSRRNRVATRVPRHGRTPHLLRRGRPSCADRGGGRVGSGARRPSDRASGTRGIRRRPRRRQRDTPGSACRRPRGAAQ